MDSTPSRLVSVIVPCFNERATLERAVTRLIDADYGEGISKEILIVDDGSSDGSVEIARSLDEDHESVRLLSLSPNRGKGAALRAGLREATGDIVLIHDADLEYDPADHPRVLAPILDGRADAVIGTRFGGQTHRVLYFVHALANKAITFACDFVADLNLGDIECCTKAFRKDVIDRITIQEEGFGVEPELVIKLGRLRNEGGKRLCVYEVAVSYDGRTYAEGKKIRASDGLWALWCIAKYGCVPMMKRAWEGPRGRA